MSQDVYKSHCIDEELSEWSVLPSARAGRSIALMPRFSSGQFNHSRINYIIIHQTHYEKSDWSRAFNQFTIACELDMINAISAADIAIIMSSSTSAWLPSPLELACVAGVERGRGRG